MREEHSLEYYKFYLYLRPISKSSSEIILTQNINCNSDIIFKLLTSKYFFIYCQFLYD